MKLNEKIIDPSYGIFTAIANLDDSLPWLKGISNDLDVEYLYNQSGEKELTLLGFKCELNQIAHVCLNKFGDNWNRLYDAYVTKQYEPIENYSMTEIETPDLSDIRTSSKTHSGTNKNTIKTDVDDANNRETMQSTDITTTDNGKTGIYGFNSGDESVPSDSSDTTNKVIGSMDKNKIMESNNTITSTSETNDGTVSNTETETDTNKHTGTRTLTRSGNIGVTTSQQMLQSEIELRKWNLYNRMFEDVDSVLVQELYI